MKSLGAAITLTLGLTACGGVPVRDAATPKARAVPSPTSHSAGPEATSPSGTPKARGGAYYQDDGPAREAPEHLDRIPNAVPRLEPINKGTARPYEVLGKGYTPHTSLKPFRQRGMASWYGKKYHGRKTASGETYDMFAMSAAHTVLPLPSYVRVTNPANGRQVIVRVNDRGPFHRERIIDLSFVAAHRLGLIGKGSGEVEIEQIIPGANDIQTSAPAAKAETPPGHTTGGPDQLISKIPKDDGALLPGVYVQLGAFGNPDNAELLRHALGRELEWLDEPIHIVSGGNFHRVQVGPYRDRASAERIATRIVDAMGGKPAFVTR